MSKTTKKETKKEHKKSTSAPQPKLVWDKKLGKMVVG